MRTGDRVQAVYAAKSEAELESSYDDWADEYDSDLGADSAWISPRVAVEYLVKHVAADAKILDAGAGTGLVGQRLLAAGYANLHAIDLSPGMLAVAHAKSVYRELRRMTLGAPLAFADEAFDAVVAVGVFTTGHAPAHAFDELVRITKPQGVIVFSLRTGEIEDAFARHFAVLEAAGRWRLAERSERFRPLPKAEPEVTHRVWVYRTVATDGRLVTLAR